jgi:glycosyltransferase involved in cell wall biosynthesis
MLITETYPPEVNGAAITLSQLAEGLVARGHHVHIVRPTRDKNDKAVKPPGNPTHSLVLGVPFLWCEGIRIGIPYLGQLKREIEKFKPDVMHIATEGWLGLAGVMAANYYKVPVVSSYHTNFFAYSRFYGLGFLRSMGYWYFRWLHNCTRKTFVPSKTTQTQLQSYKFKNLEIMSRGCDTDRFSPSRRREALKKLWGARAEDPVMLYVGRIAPEKNIRLLIKCYERIKEKIPSAKLVFVGDGPEKKSLEREYPEVIFAGMKIGTELAEYFASADLFVYPSVTETYGRVTTEAMASGLVVLAYDYAAAKENIQNGVNGYLAPYRKEHEFLKRFDELLKERDKWGEISHRAAASMKENTWENVVAKYEQSILGFCKPSKAATHA